MVWVMAGKARVVDRMDTKTVLSGRAQVGGDVGRASSIQRQGRVEGVSKCQKLDLTMFGALGALEPAL